MTSRPGSTETETMRAVVQDGYGSADVLHVARLPRPAIGEDEVLVRVHAAGLDRGTWHLMAGYPYAARLALGLRRPRQPVVGRDVAGTVVSVGAGVTGFAVGDEVFGMARGSFAEYAAVSVARLAHKPAGLSFEQAAVVPISGGTALQAVHEAGRVQAGQQVLVHGASGGVGGYAVQIAKAAGATVTGVASGAKLDLVRSLGADRVLDYSRDDFADGSHHYDLVVDTGGDPSLGRLRRALTPTGTAVIVGGEGGGSLTGMGRQLRAVMVSPFVRQRLTMLASKERAADLERLRDLIEAGHVTPHVDRTYPLDRAADAMRQLVAGEVRGKLAITL